VFVATSTGLLKGYDAFRSNLKMSIPLGETPSGTTESHTDMAAGNGLIVVPCGTHLVAVGTPYADVNATLNPATPDGANGWYKTPVTVTITASAGTIYYTLDGGATQTYTAPVTVADQAQHTLQYWSSDAAGNTTAKKTIGFNIDATAPTSSASVAGTKLVTGAYAGVVTVTLSAVDPLSGVASTSYSVDGAASKTYIGPFTVSGIGAHKVLYHSVDKAGNTEADVTLNVSISAGNLKAFAAGIQLISAPENYAGSPVSKIFDPPVKLAAWDPLPVAYAISPNAPADTIRPGVGYWASIPAGGADLYDTGVPTDTTQPYLVDLKKGWNLIGDPFPSPVALAALQAVSQSGGVYPVGTLGSIVSQTLYTYGPGATAYVPVTGGSLTPFAGYWILAYQPCTLVFPGTSGPPAAPFVRRR